MRIVLLVLALLGTALAVPRNIQRIVGGVATTVEEHPFMCRGDFGWWGGIIWGQACGGSLITTNAVLTAAHCVVGDSPSSWRIVVGTSFRNSGGTTHPASRIVVHPDYDILPIDADVAIIGLATPATLSPSVGLARIAGPNYHLSDHTTVKATGWGTLASGGSSPDQLQEVDKDVINQELCAERYAYLKTQPGFAGWPDITPGMMCTGILDVGGKDACQGDSGGPVTHDRDVVVGVTSWGYGCGHEFYPGVIARVSHYSNWIVNNA